MKTSRLAMITFGCALTGSTVLGAATPAQAATSSGCATGRLPSSVVGSPSVRAHQAKGIYLWHDSNGYSLRVTEPTTKTWVVTGSITVSRDISRVRLVRTEKGDSVTVHGSTLSFRLVNHGGIDGVTFSAECSKAVRVAARGDGTVLTPQQVFLGAHRVHPTSVPFVIERA